jgi:hypothetical protein
MELKWEEEVLWKEASNSRIAINKGAYLASIEEKEFYFKATY